MSRSTLAPGPPRERSAKNLEPVLDRLDATDLRGLAPADGPAVVVTLRALELPVAHRAGAVTVYHLRP